MLSWHALLKASAQEDVAVALFKVEHQSNGAVLQHQQTVRQGLQQG